MIAQLTGTVVEVRLDRAVLDVGGVGFEVLATPSTLQPLRPGARASLATHLVVREDALTLVGFANADEREVFTVLLSVPKVGPKLALAALAVLTPDQLRQAVAGGDEAALMAIPGVGRKSAQRMIIDIGDKLGAPSATSAAASPVRRDDLVEALENLGWARAKAADAVAAVAEATPDADDAALLRAALRELGSSRG